MLAVRTNERAAASLGVNVFTTKLHAFGPMGARELTAEKFVVFGDGQVRL